MPIRILIKAVPGAKRTEIVGMLGDRLKVRVSAPAEDGRANAAICKLIATTLDLKTRNVSVVAGHAHAEKTIEIEGLQELPLHRLLH